MVTLTKTRRELLQAVAEGLVWGFRKDIHPAGWRWVIVQRDPVGFGSKTVTKTADNLYQMRLITRGKPVGPSVYSGVPYVLTEAGRKALEQP